MTTPNLPPEVRDLLEAIREALDVPANAHTEDQGRYLRVLAQRAAYLRGVLRHVLEQGSVGRGTAQAAHQAAEHYPVTYTPYRPPAPAPWEVLRHGAVVATLPDRDAARTYARDEAEQRHGWLADQWAWHPADGGEALWLVVSGQATESGWAVRPAAGGEGR